MPKNTENIQTIALPELIATRFNLLAANLAILATSDIDGGPIGDQSQARLILEGEEDAFTHQYQDGVLTVAENGDDTVNISNSGSNIVIGGSGGIRISGLRGASIRVNGASIQGGSFSAEPRRATLVLPLQHRSAHFVETVSGDVTASGIEVQRIRVKTLSGGITVSSLISDETNFKTMSGDVTVDGLNSASAPSMDTMGGDIKVSHSSAPEWILNTMGGDITVDETDGGVSASSMSGTTRVS